MVVQVVLKLAGVSVCQSYSLLLFLCVFLSVPVGCVVLKI